ncbi:hypothetical protein DUI87_02734 [Hirundo rustica rustica]|uniref:ribonuclease H n=1 Tax=Hirundo rustica rustica TaxID=333673 RepID=A0A3M0L979_HIRRU|nr:hypothetical protein DUI87_02734 [Hirundo rustica rustica]
MHIPEYSQIVSPLYLVTRKKNDFHWGLEQQQAFAQIKQEITHAVALSPVRTGPDVKNMLYSAARNHGLSWSLWQKVPGETRGRPLGFWSRSYRGSEAIYTPTEKEILAAYEGVQAASEVIGTETQLLLAPRLPVLGWMFKGKVPSTHHATDTTWSKWIALITQRARIGNPNRPGILEIITNWPEEWRKYGDKLWELVLDDDKSAKKMSKFWKIVQNELLKCEAEKQAVVAAKEAQGKNKIYYGHPSDPNPPGVAFVDLPPPQPPPTAPPLPSNADPLSPTPPDPPATEPFPGALSDLAEAMAQGRRETWAALAQQGWQREDPELAAAAQEQIDTCAFPVIFQPNPQGGQRAELVNLDWKLLSQLRATVASYGVTSEPAKQMLEFLFNANLLLPSDIRGISKLIYTPHQRLLFEARWREEAAMSAALPRPQGDPLTGLTMDELMGQGPFHRIEAQVALGQEKLREAMAVARRAMGKIRAPGGTPIYMGIKQGRDEPLGSFVDKIIEALSKAGIGGIRLAQRSPLLTVEVDDKLAKAVFSLTPLPAEVDCILGRDVLTQLGGEPDKRFEWTVLPQGMRNSPTSCQLYVDTALQPVRRALPDTIIYHYMDDILFAQSNPFDVSQDRKLSMDNISQVIHNCETCAAIKQVKRVKPLWYSGRWLTYRYGEAWQIDYITLPQIHQGKHYVLTMVKATTGWLETYPVPHATAWNIILGLENQVLW